MSADCSGDAAQNTDWEQRQKHAAFYQAQITFMQQSFIGSITAFAIVIPLGAAMAKFPDVANRDWLVISFAVGGWLVSTLLSRMAFQRSARRVQGAYLREQAELFPTSPPYRLESFLVEPPKGS